MADRRSILGATMAAITVPMAGAAAAAPARFLPVRTSSETGERHVPGGIRGLETAKYTFTKTSSDGTYGTIKLPVTPEIYSYMLPLTVEVFDESLGSRYQMRDGVVNILKDGLYIMSANLDWPAAPHDSGQDGHDTDVRVTYIKRVPVGMEAPKYFENEVTRLRKRGPNYEAMATHHMAGSSAPHTVRKAVKWAPGTIPAGGMVYKDVAVAEGNFTADVGDLARAGHTSLSDKVLGAANAGLLVSARVVGPLLVRVMIENRYNAGPVNIPSGTLNLMAESSVTSAGNSADAMCFICSGAVELFAGDKIFIAARSHSRGDYIQISEASFLRITNLA